MIFLLQYFFLLAIDLMLAVTLSCLLYAFACMSIACLTCCIVIFSFGTVGRNVDVKGRAIVILVSNSSIGRMFARNLDKAGFGVSAAQWPAQEERTAIEECSSNNEVAQLNMTEDDYQKTVKTFIESHLSLKGPAEEGHFGSQSTHREASRTAATLRRGGIYGKMRKPSILIWEEGAPDTHGLPERKTSCDGKKNFKAPRRNSLLQSVLYVTVLFYPLNCVLSLLKRSSQLLVPLLKSKN